MAQFTRLEVAAAMKETGMIPLFFSQDIELSKKVNFDAWADFPAFVAASYLQLKDYENVWKCWNIYLNQFKDQVYSGEKPLEEHAIEWLVVINPFKEYNYLMPLVEFIKSEKDIKFQLESKVTKNTNNTSFILKGDIWELSYKNYSINLKDAKGFHDIYKLLNNPSKEFHCLDLMGAAVDENSSTASIDQKAKQQYLNRIKELQQDIDEAEEMNIAENITALREEYDSILEHLSNSLGLSGKARKVGSTIEKARSAVTWRIRSAIKKIDSLHPDLATHLSNSIKTGTHCVYQPEHTINWLL